MTVSVKNFTDLISFTPAPAAIPEPWLTGDTFKWILDYEDPQSEVVIVPEGFAFDGASVPPIPFVRLLFPRVHPLYMQSAALHDYCLQHQRHRFSRSEIDYIFEEALIAQKNPDWRVSGMYQGVSIWGKLSERKKYYLVA